MRTFVVLIPAEGAVEEPRTLCESLEGTKFDIGGSVQATAFDVAHQIFLQFGLENHCHVATISDFMKHFNDGKFDLNDYYISYVYA